MVLHPFTVLEVIQDSVVNPGVPSIAPMFLFAFFNDLVGLFPFALYLAGQLVFYKGALSLAFWMKLTVFVSIPVGFGSALGSAPFYFAAYYGGKPLLTRYQPFFKKYLRFDWHGVERVSNYFKGVWYDEIIFFVLRCAPVIPSIPLDLTGGLLRMGPVPFFVFTVVGSIVRMMITFAAVGLSLHGLHDLSHL